MSKLTELIKNIKSTSNYLNTQIELLTNNLDDNINLIIQKTQADLISNICQDYNLNIKELSKKYLTKIKSSRKSKENIINDSPTYQTIKTMKEELSDENTDTDLIIKQNIINKKKIKKEKIQIDKPQKNEVETNETTEIVYKTITLKGKKYLLDPNSNILFDFENNEVGKKEDNKYLMKKL